MPPANTPVGGPVHSLSLGETACALMQSGIVRCWGPGLEGGLGYGNVSNMGDQPGEMPTPALQLPVGNISFLESTSITRHHCAVYEDMGVTCWGWNENGQLGYGHILTIGDGPNEMPPAWVF
jgi:alpha-tubulin suppressor-like RCC1 family protein